MGVEGLRSQQSLRTQLNPALFSEDSMNISLVSSTSSQLSGLQ
jgi:hypothetical protein